MNLGIYEIIILLILCIPVLLAIVFAIFLIVRRSDLLGLGRKPCPYCAEWIRPQAKICPHCGRELPAGWQNQNE